MKVFITRVIPDAGLALLLRAGLREDLMSNDELREQSGELLDTLLKSISEKNIDRLQSEDFDGVNQILSGISISRARQGFEKERCMHLGAHAYITKPVTYAQSLETAKTFLTFCGPGSRASSS